MKSLDKYKNDPVLFAEEVLGVQLKGYQKVLLRAVAKGERIICARRTGIVFVQDAHEHRQKAIKY
ncbi:hypothetical protein NBRC13296_12420 [Paenibacillus chitinolyticus]|uniref:hypothetical protein n=1 Tax=Paenibacillus chitinolyticus TaxID=79263 RepID=UPI0035578C57